MSSISETGHAVNVANLQKMIEQISVLTNYNPPVAQITVSALQTLYTTAMVKLSEVEDKRRANKTAIDNRKIAFEKLKPTTTKIVNLLDILGLSDGTMSQAKSINRDIQGKSKKATPKPTVESLEPSKTISTSRQSYAEQADSFHTLLQLLETFPSYTPNEDPLKIANLKTYYDTLMSATQAVNQTESELNNQMIDRDKLLYANDTGMYSISQDVKKYVKSLYGATSPEFKKISAIEFTTTAR